MERRTTDMVDNAVEAVKAELRSRAHAARSALAEDDRKAWSAQAAGHFFKSISLSPGEIVACYWPIRDELDCQPILVRLVDSGQPVCLPVVLGPEQPLELRLWEVGTPLYPAGFGTLAPSDLAPHAVPDVILMPLLGFDGQGTRLGYGGGYYDRTLAQLRNRPRLIGLAFAEQEVDTIPREEHDVPLEAIVTQFGVRRFGADSA